MLKQMIVMLAATTAIVAALGFALICPFEQWVTLKFGVHMGDQVEVGQLQQLDRLHQLRRHHQGLGLAKL